MILKRQSTCILLISSLAIMLFTACSKTQKSSDSAWRTSNTKNTDIEIVCWGDSMTRGDGASEAEITMEDGRILDVSFLAYPEILEKLTGIKTYNFGVSGATSEEIAIMQGGLKPAEDIRDYDTINESVIKQGKQHKGDILILEIGSNGGWDGDYETLISQYRAMIKYSGCSKYIIIGDTDDPLNSADESVVEDAMERDGEEVGTEENAWETALRVEFGDHFINMRTFMISKGLQIAGITPTDADEEAAQYGMISVQLRADWTHFNSYGYYAKAVGVYEKGKQLGYWE